jgi:hypothetical protein
VFIFYQFQFGKVVLFLGLDPLLRREISRYVQEVQFCSRGWILFSGGR